MDKGTRGSAILDLILTYKEEQAEEVEVAGTLGEGGCVLLEMVTASDAKTQRSQAYNLNLWTMGFRELREKLDRMPWLDILREKSIHEGWMILKSRGDACQI